MFKGLETRDSYCCAKEKRYPKDVVVIFNKKAYANTTNLKS